MDEDKIIRKISLEFFDVPYEELNTSEQLIVRNELKKELKRIREPIPRPPSYAGGGMMNINDITRPVGMADGGLPKEEQVSASGTHPLVVFKEMYDQYRIDGVPIAGEKEPLSFKDFFEIIQIQLNNQASS